MADPGRGSGGICPSASGTTAENTLTKAEEIDGQEVTVKRDPGGGRLKVRWNQKGVVGSHKRHAFRNAEGGRPRVVLRGLFPFDAAPNVCSDTSNEFRF